MGKMKITFTPKTYLGKLSVRLIAGFFIFLALFFMFISLGERGGMAYWDNLKLAIPGTAAALCGILSFFTGIVSLIKKKERGIFVYLSTFLGLLILLWCLTEILFPH